MSDDGQAGGSAPMLVPPQPVPMSVLVDVVPLAGGQQTVMLRIATATGLFVAFLNGEGARDVGERLTGAGRRLESGIVVAGAHQLPPHGPTIVERR